MNPLRTLARRAKFAVDWRRTRAEMRAAGVDVDRLPRIREFVQTRTRLRRPDYVHPLQRPTGFIRTLVSRPWYDPEDFEWIARLEAEAEAIRDEVLALRRSGRFLVQHQGITSAGAWNVFYFYNYGDRIDENCDLCPRTARVVESIAEARFAGRIYFSVLAPGTRVNPHCGPSNTRLRCHLGLVVPAGCHIRVGDETRQWTEGRCIVFDDSYEHEVWNEGTADRIVLIVDVWHPELSPDEIEAVRRVTAMREGVTRLTDALQKGATANPVPTMGDEAAPAEMLS